MVNGTDEKELRRRTKRFQCIDRIADPIEVARLVAFLLGCEASLIIGAFF
jgi:NAD(P)-dependent dehydrogenase (short-subunit alcohol dehydrogenase family)